MQDNANHSNTTINQNINYIKLVKILWSRWYWIAASITISLLIAYVYVWYTPKQYSTSATLKFDEKKNEISELLKGQYIYDKTNKLESETYVLKSRTLLLNAIERLDYKIIYNIKGRFRDSELYPYNPFDIELIKRDSLHSAGGPYEIQLTSHSSIRISYTKEDKLIIIKKDLGDVFELGGNLLKLNKINIQDKSIYSFNINKKENLLGRVYGGLKMKETAKNSNIMTISHTDRNPYFARDIVNAILKAYLENDKDERSKSASQIISFIDNQLISLSDKVSISQNNLQSYKNKTGIYNFEEFNSNEIKKLNNYEQSLSNIELQGILFNQIEDQIKNNKDQIYINYNIDAGVEGLLGGLIGQLNKSIAELNQKSTLYNKDSQIIVTLKSQINEIRKAIVRNIMAQRDRNNKTKAFLEKNIQNTIGSVKNISEKEKSYVNLEREYNINEKIFTYLAEKKLEAQISRAAILSGANIINEAQLSQGVVAPIAAKIYVSALLMGIAFGGGLIILIRIINPYIYDKETVESLTQKPIIGVVRKYPGKIEKNNTEILSLVKPKSVFAESIRSVRTNLSFLASEKASKVICITSEISGEGKSFMTINLASTLALIDKRVIVIAADLRKSKLHKTFLIDNKAGLSTYLTNQNTVEDIVFKTEHNNLYFIPSGPQAPNPSELLHSSRMTELITKLSESYDYVVIDTAPVGLVSDSIPLIRKADINLFVIRSGVSKFTAANIPDRLAREYSFNNIAIVLNAFSDDPLYSSYYSTNYSNGGYGGYYYYSDYSGYNYDNGYFDDEDPRWWNVMKHFKNWRKNKS